MIYLKIVMGFFEIELRVFSFLKDVYYCWIYIIEINRVTISSTTLLMRNAL